ncbi:MAG TPA: hypothetical protein VGB05_11340 [Pyrinomonadaceae bacterium]|jgi:hypothetical protein
MAGLRQRDLGRGKSLLLTADELPPLNLLPGRAGLELVTLDRLLPP